MSCDRIYTEGEGSSEERPGGARRGVAMEMGAAHSVCEAGVLPSAGWRHAGVYGGGRRTATSAKAPLGSIATQVGILNMALPLAPSPKPAEPLPASVVVSPVAISTRRTRWFQASCDASWEDTLRKS